MKKFFILFLSLVLPIFTWAQTYSLNVGDTQYLAVPSVSIGYVSKAVWACSNSSIQFVEKSEIGATVKVVSSFSGTATVELVYVQTYIGTYSGRTEAVTHTKNFYIQCSGGSSGGVVPTSVSLPDGLTVEVGKSVQIVPSLVPSNASTKFSWSTESITGRAGINGSGLVTGYESGTVRVNVSTENNLSASCVVRVFEPGEAISIKLPDSQIIGLGEQVTIRAVVEPENSNTTLTWKSSNTDVATVRAGGLVTGCKIGKADITVKTTNGLTDTCHVFVHNKASREALENAYTKAKIAIGLINKYKK